MLECAAGPLPISQQKIARHLHIARCTIAKYLDVPAPAPIRRDRARKLDPFKPAINDLLQQDPAANAPLIAQRLLPLGYEGGVTIVKDYLRAVRQNVVARRAYVRVEPGPGERFDIDWGHFDALVYNGATRKLYAFCLVESHSRKIYLEFTHSQTFETLVRCHIHAFMNWAVVRANFGTTISPPLSPNTMATWCASIRGSWVSLASTTSSRGSAMSGRLGNKGKCNAPSDTFAKTSGHCDRSPTWPM